MGVAPNLGYRAVESVAGLVSRELARFLVGRLRALMQGFSILRKPLQVAVASFWTLLVWTCVALSTYLLFPTFEIRVGFPGAALLTMVLALSVGLPQAPGFVGVFHWAAATVLQTCFGVDEASAKACAIVLWLVHLVVPVLAGFPSLAIEGISFSEIRKLGDRGEAPEGP
jgi:glycosyltransferase 2 family protein